MSEQEEQGTVFNRSTFATVTKEPDDTLEISVRGVEMPHETTERYRLSLFIPGIPKGQPRPRAFSRGGITRVYDPGSAEHWKSSIAVAIESVLPRKPLDGPLRVHLVFAMPRPKSHYRTGKFKDRLKERSPIHHTKKPDIDNLIKSFFDALTEIGFWKDDSVVALISVVKLYVDDGRPGCQVLIEEIIT